tara:strand:+ start:718 stop:990 length:273 start_codon:yes stop_codon:yes gene_type:complete
MFTDANSNSVKTNQVLNQQSEKQSLKEYSSFCRSYYDIVEVLSQKINSKIVESNILNDKPEDLKQIIDLVNLEIELSKNWGLETLTKKFK